MATTAAIPGRRCIIGVARRTWHPDEVGPDGAPEPLAMWEQVAREAAADAGAPGALGEPRVARRRLLPVLAVRRPGGRGWPSAWAPPRPGPRYSGIGGSVPQVLVAEAAAGGGWPATSTWGWWWAARPWPPCAD